ncbi:hypothetical protein FD754_005000 [Muntiacus muntjak]|uniref:C2H2-type domain-containing protein n=1 Tax=Muntiacus muntjak TaxID=9888 RepID=A0A5N3WH78_MUNMU|nr:hypothetical protein FD754_005000 [Muntiacus muntjak]
MECLGRCPHIPTLQDCPRGLLTENMLFINKMKDQLLPEKACELSLPPRPTLLTVSALVSLLLGISMDTESKQTSQVSITENITVVPVPSTDLMIPGVSCSQGWRREVSQSSSLVTTASSAQTFPILALMTKNQALESGLLKMNDPYVLSPKDEDGHQKDSKTSRSEMQIHSKSHTGAKPHKCPPCSKTFANSSQPAQHICIHSGAKPYGCNFCGKSSCQLSHLQQHTQIHTRDKPLKHNKDKPLRCHNSHQEYTVTTSLEGHLSTHAVRYLMKYMHKHNSPDLQQQVQQWQRQWWLRPSP